MQSVTYHRQRWRVGEDKFIINFQIVLNLPPITRENPRNHVLRLFQEPVPAFLEE
jgi:hypothetical protein